ncbi:hypothetical protein [uncultured Paludibaculum sp.]|uniref:hypothetical protein n=1 Tax=uncultured Paludibaculum sp. TaxID=1765020 RepID=UPI002AAAE701|nr:hypothetical protein [uncultured Paludibaculum sp.]
MWPKASSAAKAPAHPVSAMPPGLPPTRPARQAPESYAGFDCLQADDATHSYGRGWSGSATGDNRMLPYIQAEGDLPFVDIPAKLKELIDHCWKLGSVSQAAPRSHVQMGMGRVNALQQAQNSWKPADIIAANRIKENGRYVKEVSPVNAYKTIAQDWKLTEQLERVNAYTFRGDSRNPRAVEADGGFHPPVSRTDKAYVETVVYPMFNGYMKRRFGMEIPIDQFHRIYHQTVTFPKDQMAMKTFFAWRALVDIESHHIARMMSSEILKNYISTSKDVGVAKNFTKAKGGWIYVTLVRGGFHLTSDHQWGQGQRVSEQEIALPGSLPWTDIFGFRQCVGCLLVGPLYLRQGFGTRNPSAHRQVFELMSNKRQTL